MENGLLLMIINAQMEITYRAVKIFEFGRCQDAAW